MSKGKESKYELILETAFQLFLEKGYVNTKIIDIANEAGIGKGTVYEYFKSKESLFCEIFKRKVISQYTKMNTVILDHMSCQEKLQAAILYELHTISQFGNNKNILSNLMLKTEFLQNREIIEAMYDLMNIKLNLIHDIIQEGISKGEFVDVDPLMATFSIAGSLNYYISFGLDFALPFEGLCKEKKAAWENTEFFHLIFDGLKK